MKMIILLSLLLLVATSNISCQATQRQPLSQTDYWNKSKKQKKTARILLIGGGALIASSFIIPKGEVVSEGFCGGAWWWCDDEYKNDGLKGAVFIAGGLAALGSIPFSIASSKNRKRAKNATVFIDVEKHSAVNALLIRNQSFPVVVFKLPL